MPERVSKTNGASRLSNVWNFFFWCDPNNFLARLVAMDETWLYHYDPETKQRSAQWPPQKNPSAKNRWKSSRHASVFWD
jgi:hypothetical protein